MFGKKKLYKITYIRYDIEYSNVLSARSAEAAAKKLLRRFQIQDIISVEEIQFDDRK